MKSEGKLNIELVGLKSKMYSLIDVDGRKNKKEKESLVLLLIT